MSSSQPNSPGTPGKQRATITSPKSPRKSLTSPKKSPKPGRNTLGSPKSPGKQLKTRPSMQVPGNWERTSVYVYEKPKGNHTINNVPDRLQGVWEDGYSGSVSPTELWLFPNGQEPGNLEGSKHIHGEWGYKPGVEVDPTNDPNNTQIAVEDMWFFSPQAKAPSYFTKRGVWTYPLVKKDISQIAPETAGFINVGESVKSHKLDVGGTWKMLYQRPGEPVAQGPGMKSTPREAPKPKPTMKIHVRKGNKKFTIDGLYPTNTIDDVKNDICFQERIPKNEQRLLWGGKELENEPTLQDCNIQDGSTLDMDGMKLYVQDLKGKTFELTNVDPEESVEDVKDRIQDVKQIPKADQRLTFQGKPLIQGTLQANGIAHDSTLKLEPTEILVKTAAGEIIPVQVAPNDKVQDIKKKVEQQAGIPIAEQRLFYNGNMLDDPVPITEYEIEHGSTLELEGMQIYVKDWKGKTFEMEVEATNTIEQLKDRIQDEQGIPKQYQRLTFSGEKLEADKTLRDYMVPHKGTLELEPLKIHVKTTDGKKLPLTVDPMDTIDTVKSKMKKQHGIPKDEQRLTFNGKLLGDGTTLADNRIKYGSTLDMEGMQLYVQDTTGKKHLLSVEPTDTIESVKDQLDEQFQILKLHQRMFHNGEECENDKTLREYKIEHKDTLILEKIRIYVITPKGKKLYFDVMPTDKVREIKKMVYEREHLLPREQRMKFGEQMLDDAYKLEHFHIGHHSTIILEPMEIFVEDWNGEEFPVEVEPTDTIATLKDKIEKQEGIPKDQQRLFHDEEKLNDNKTLRDYKLRHKSVLQLHDMEIHVNTPDGKKITLSATPNDTVADVKKKLQDKEGIPAEDQRLTFGGKELADVSTLAENKINHGSTLAMEGMQIIIKDWNGKKFTLDVEPGEKMTSVKSKIEKKNGIPPHQQFLLFGKKLLDDDGLTLAQWGIEHKSTLDLDRMKVIVETSNGKFVLNVEPTTTVEEIKKMVDKKVGIPPDVQKVEFQGTELSNPSTVEENDIRYKDILDVGTKIVPEYTVQVGPWQNPFEYNPKPKIKREGVRARKHYNRVSDFYATAANTDIETNKWDTCDPNKDADEKE
jgi:ubiquitin C